MKRIHFELIRVEEELAGVRQCVICLCGALLASSGMALGCWCGVMENWMLLAGCALLLLFLALGTAFAILPEVRARKLERELWRADGGGHVDPHQ